MNIITKMIVKANVEIHHSRAKLGQIYIFIPNGDRKFETLKKSLSKITPFIKYSHFKQVFLKNVIV